MMLRRKNDIEAALSPVLFKLNSNNNESKKFSYQDSIFTPGVSAVNTWLNSIDVETLKQQNREYERMFYIKKRMGKLFDMDRYYHSCKDIDKDVSVLKNITKRKVSCFGIRILKNGKRR